MRFDRRTSRWIRLVHESTASRRWSVRLGSAGGGAPGGVSGEGRAAGVAGVAGVVRALSEGARAAGARRVMRTSSSVR
ncbi:hypothetical protein DRB87_18235 [Pandoraea sp. XY-2]|nr:hypothetical protein DRB87_18235 [Pandoraea sp. XY-2]